MQRSASRLSTSALVVLVACASFGFSKCESDYGGSPFFHFMTPEYRQLSELGDFDFSLRLPWLARVSNLDVTLAVDDGAAVPLSISDQSRSRAEGAFSAPVGGAYQLAARADVRLFFFFEFELRAKTLFKVVALENSDECDVLNSVSCMIPYPTHQYLREDATSNTGYRVDISNAMLPVVNGPPLEVDDYLHLDGTSPTVQILMHFPGGVDVAASDAPRLLAPGPVPVSPPYIDTRTYDGRAVESDSPTLLIRASTGERVLHFVEMDARSVGHPDRQLMVMRPGEILVPGERYIVAIRNLVSPGGSPVEAEAPFEALRDRNPTTIASLAARRGRFETKIFEPLAAQGVERDALVLAFDFTVQSDEAMTYEMLSMRDQAFAWLDAQQDAGVQTFAVDSVVENDCTVPGETVWKILRGTFEVPLFLTSDPELDALAPGMLEHDSDGLPTILGTTEPPYTVSLPCSLHDPTAPDPNPIVLGHGLFGAGEGMVLGFANEFGLDYITAATNWRGLSGDRDGNNRSDLEFVVLSVVGFLSSHLNDFPAMPDRLRQGQLNTLVLAHMMKTGVFNIDSEFVTAAGRDAFGGESVEMFYYGISLGGIMGTMFAALTPDVTRHHVDVPAVNFGFLLQRSTQFGRFELPLIGIGLTDPAETLLGLGLIHELWVRGEPAAYTRHITGLVDAPLPGSHAKKMLMTVAWLDKQVSNNASEVMARSLGISNIEGSVQQGLQAIPDASGPLDSALVIYDTGSFDIFDPAHVPFIPELANTIPSGVCDPHNGRRQIPAAIDQMLGFLQPGGVIENLCTGVCDAGIPYERPGGTDAVCDPLAP